VTLLPQRLKATGLQTLYTLEHQSWLQNVPFQCSLRRSDEVEDEASERRRTALIQTDPEYFGFVG
jgi:hypothetical protein